MGGVSACVKENRVVVRVELFPFSAFGPEKEVGIDLPVMG